jgi:DNA-binding response OmpR family regulator
MTTKQTKKQKILVVDDEPHIVNLIRLTLTGEKYEVYSAYSGHEALQLVNQIMPDLIVLDLIMPAMDGYEVCEEIRKNPKTANIPIMILSAKSQLADKFKSINVGADDYMVKPFSPEELVKRVKVNIN